MKCKLIDVNKVIAIGGFRESHYDVKLAHAPLPGRQLIGQHCVSQCKTVDFNHEKDQLLVVINRIFLKCSSRQLT